MLYYFTKPHSTYFTKKPRYTYTFWNKWELLNFATYIQKFYLCTCTEENVCAIANHAYLQEEKRTLEVTEDRQNPPGKWFKIRCERMQSRNELSTQPKLVTVKPKVGVGDLRDDYKKIKLCARLLKFWKTFSVFVLKFKLLRLTKTCVAKWWRKTSKLLLSTFRPIELRGRGNRERTV